MRIQKKSGEIIDIESEEILDAADLASIVGREDDPIVQALITEIRRLGTVLSQAQPNPAPVVNVSPSIAPALINVEPTVTVDTHREWEVTVTEHYMSGPLQGKIRKVLFKAL